MLFYDYEVFKYDWLVVILDMDAQQEHIIVNDKDKLEALYQKNKNNIWVGYNSRSYDQYIKKGILCGFDPKKISDSIIVKKQKGWQYSKLLNKYPFVNYDTMPNPPIGLKTLEGFMGNDIRESSVPFDIDRKLTPEEIQEVIQYCRHDVHETVKVFMERYADFEAMLEICRVFNLPLIDIGKTEAGITAKVLDCEPRNFNDEFEYFFLPCIKLKKYAYVMEWFKNAPEDCTKEMKQKYQDALSKYKKADTDKKKKKFKKLLDKYDWTNEEAWKKYFYSRKLTVYIAGIPHTFGFGGIHGAHGVIKVTKSGEVKVKKKPIHRKGLILHIDVGSYYPSLLIAWELITRAAKHPEKYKEVYDTRMALKKAGKKKEQAPYKKLLNALSGAMKDEFNPAYDPRNNNIMCINGQLMLLDLIEKLESVPGFELIQSNTDGLIIMIPDTDEAFNMVDDICYEWESRCSTDKCSILLGLDQIDEIYQKDVNNYIWIEDGKQGERKGKYVKELSEIDADLPIINDALVNYMVNKIPVEVTIHNCDELKPFQKLVKLSDNYKWVEHNGKKYTYKSYRVFASKGYEGKIYKCGGSRGSDEKFADTPDNCFILNDDINGMKCPPNLDKGWYVQLAKERLKQFGVL